MSTDQNSPRPFYLWGEHKVTLDFDVDLDDYFKQKALKELRESPEIVEEGLNSLKKLLEEDTELVISKDDVILTRFLRCCKWYPKNAFKKVKVYYEIEASYPKYFRNVIPRNEIKVLRSGIIRHLPYRNPDGTRILLCEAGGKWDPNIISPTEILRGLSLTMNALNYEPKTQVAGVHVILDFVDMSASLIRFITPYWILALVKYLQTGMPGRSKGIHIIRQPFYFNIIWALFKPLINSKYRKRLHFHGYDLKSLQKYIHSSVLPKEFDGELELSLDDPVNDDIFNLFNSYEQRFLDVAKFGYNSGCES